MPWPSILRRKTQYQKALCFGWLMSLLKELQTRTRGSGINAGVLMSHRKAATTIRRIKNLFTIDAATQLGYIMKSMFNWKHKKFQDDKK